MRFFFLHDGGGPHRATIACMLLCASGAVFRCAMHARPFELFFPVRPPTPEIDNLALYSPPKLIPHGQIGVFIPWTVPITVALC